MHFVPESQGKTQELWITLGDLARGRTHGRPISACPYWWRDALPSERRPEPHKAKADVVVIGAGFTGLVAALVLARAGRHVLAVDADTPGFGASTRNGGQVGSGNQKFRVKTLIAIKGERKAVELLREGVEMLDGIESLINEEKIDCAFTRCGRFRGAMRPAHYEAMARDMEDLAHYTGVEFAMIARRDQHCEIGTDRFYGGSLLFKDASLHPAKYHAGLMARVLAAGADVWGHAPVRGIVSDQQGHTVHFDGFDVRARDVLVATNGYTKGVGAFFQRRIVPIPSAQIATGLISPQIFRELMPRRRVYGNTNRVFFYFRPAPDENRIIWGGRTKHFARASVAGAHAHLAQDLLRTFPALGDVAVTHAWNGLIGHTFDQMPHLGRSPDGIYYAMGYCGTGVSRSTHFGRKIALQILGDPAGRSAFDELTFQSHPFYWAARAAAPFVESWYRLRDAGGF